jgi:hypothetical protein
MEMKWIYGFFAFITFLTISSSSAKSSNNNNIQRWYNNNNNQRYRNNNNSPSYNSNNYNRYDDGFGSPSSSMPQQQWQNYMRQTQKWKNNFFLRQIKKDLRSCGKKLNLRIVAVCGGCPPDGLTSIRKRSGFDPKISDACCASQCGDDTIKMLACNECNI